MKDHGFDPWHAVAVAAGSGLTILSCIGVGVFIGVKCDQWLGSSPWGLLLFSFVGAAAGLWAVAKQLTGK